MLIGAFRFFDLAALLVVCIVLQFWVDTSGVANDFVNSLLSGTVSLEYVLYIVLNGVVWHVVFTNMRLYESFRLATRTVELKRILIACTFCTFGTLTISVMVEMPWTGARFGALFFVVSTLVLSLSRITMRSALKVIRLRGRNLRHVVIVGRNQKATDFYHYLIAHPELGYRVQGFVDVDYDSASGAEGPAFRVVSNVEDFPAYLRDNVIDEVFVFMPYDTLSGHVGKIVAACEEQGIIMRLRADIFSLSLDKLRVENSPQGDFPLLVLYTGLYHGWKLELKRLIDIVFSATALVLLSPLLLFIAYLVKVTSPGPSIFVQERVGLNKRRFNLYKFRTMVVDAEARMKEIEHLNEVSGPVFKIKKDPRITPIGQFLRKSSIDELPQLFNVLKGDMSLVGPRPLPTRDYEGFDQDWTRRRLSVRPGLTCIWQVSGRNNIPFERWMELDLEYIDNWSLWLDFRILLLTIPALFRTREVY